MSPEFAQFWNHQIKLVFDTQKQSMFEFDFPTPSGTRYFQSSVVPEFDEKGDIQSVLSISRDITAMRENELEKEAFLAMVTHELKTPITSVKAFTQLLEKQFTETGEKRKAVYLKKMDGQLNRLNKLIGDLLDATRLGNGKMQFNKMEWDFKILLKEIVTDMQKTTNKHRIIIKKTTSAKIYTDRDRVEQVLLNLLANAIKYSPDSLPVIVEVTKNKNFLTCSIMDSGPGIPKEKQHKLFKKFSRLSQKNDTNSPGLGLGLYISAEIIKQEGGKIWVESDKGKQTKFLFTFPLSIQKNHIKNKGDAKIHLP